MPEKAPKRGSQNQKVPLVDSLWASETHSSGQKCGSRTQFCTQFGPGSDTPSFPSSASRWGTKRGRPSAVRTLDHVGSRLKIMGFTGLPFAILGVVAGHFVYCSPRRKMKRTKQQLKQLKQHDPKAVNSFSHTHASPLF